MFQCQFGAKGFGITKSICYLPIVKNRILLQMPHSDSEKFLHWRGAKYSRPFIVHAIGPSGSGWMELGSYNIWLTMCYQTLQRILLRLDPTPYFKIFGGLLLRYPHRLFQGIWSYICQKTTLTFKASSIWKTTQFMSEVKRKTHKKGDQRPISHAWIVSLSGTSVICSHPSPLSWKGC